MQRESSSGPSRRQRHHSSNEDVDESVNLLAQEPVEIEAELPAEENQPIEQAEGPHPGSSAFEQE